MNNEIYAFLNKNRIENINLIVALQMGAKVLAFDEDGIFIEDINNIKMINCTNINKGFKWLKEMDDCYMFVSHQPEYLQSVKEKHQLLNTMTVYHCVYEKQKVPILTVPNIQIKPLDETHLAFIKKHYSSTLDDIYIIQQLQQPYFFGAYKSSELVGFIGLHGEWSIGFLEVLPQYKRQGIGAYLETYLVDTLIRNNMIPYAQIKVNNTASLRLHQKLGFCVSKQTVTWLM